MGVGSGKVWLVVACVCGWLLAGAHVSASEGLKVTVTKDETVHGGVYETETGKVLSAELGTVSMTSGISGVRVKVENDKGVPEQDVLRGVFTEYEKTSKLNTNRKQMALRELKLMETLNKSENMGKYRGKLQVQKMFVKVKEEMYKQAKLDTELTEESIERALTAAYKKTRLNNKLTEDQKQEIKKFALDYRSLELVKNNAVPKQLRELSNFTAVGAGEALQYTGEAVKDRVTTTSFMDGVRNFFKELVESIRKWTAKEGVEE